MSTAEPQTRWWKWSNLQIACRWIFVVLSIFAFAYSVRQILQMHESEATLRGSKNPQLNTVHYTDAVKAAVSQKLEGAKGLFQVTLLVIAVLWGLIIAKKEERVLLWWDKPELLMFLIANALFVASAYCYSQYMDAMATVHAFGGEIEFDEPKNLTIMDYRDPHINNYAVWQERIWWAAMSVTGLTLLSAHLLKQPSAEDQKP